MQNRGLTALDFFESVPKTYGVVNDPLNSDATDDSIEIPSTELDISNDQLQQLQAEVNQLSNSNEFGVDLYTHTLAIIRSFRCQELCNEGTHQLLHYNSVSICTMTNLQ